MTTWLTIKEVARELGWETHRVKYALRTGRLKLRRRAKNQRVVEYRRKDVAAALS